MTTDTRTEPDTTSTGDDEFIHIVSLWESVITTLRRQIPRALCGLLLEGDPDRAEPGANAPICPVCDTRASR